VKLWSWLAFFVPLGIYVASLSPYVNVWDTAELQTVPYIFGIAHPTGFPAFVLLGWAFSHAFAFGTVAWRMSLLSALCMAGAARVTYALCRRLDVPAGAAFGAALLFAVGAVAWTRGTRAEVHSLATFEAAIVATSALAWYQERNPRWLVLCAIALGVGLATHGTIVLMIPGVLVLAFAARRVPPARVLVLCFISLVAPLVTYAYIPLRSEYVTAHRLDPTLSLGLPPGRPYWDYGHPATPQAFLRYVSGSDFRAPATLASILDPATYIAIAPRVRDIALDEFPLAALLFALAGIVVLFRRDALGTLGLCLVLLPCVPFAYAYGAESDADRYALPAFILVATLCACGLTAVAALLASSDRRARDTTVCLAMLILAATELWLQRATFDQRSDTRWADYVDRVRRETPNDAILVANWAYATPLAYAAFVEHSMGNRIIETAHPADDAVWLARWVERRPVYVMETDDPSIDGVRLVVESRGDPNVFRVMKR